MFFRQALASVLHLFGVFCFFGVGCFFFGLFFLENIRMQAVEMLFAEPKICLTAGLSFFAIALVSALGFYALHRGRYLRLRLGGQEAQINVAILKDVIEECFWEHFPDSLTLLGVAVAKNRRLEIEVEIKSSEKDLLSRVELALTPLLAKRCGIVNPFYLSVRSTAKGSADLLHSNL